ncbi:hypothetical protein [Halopelagius fulvigenes]|uniref:VRR-NUC domain-containing protein n=1 Tax=Halopelagius fulvigenes TaxID=1198324 RepID=A0ABD5U3M5_9EURY
MTIPETEFHDLVGAWLHDRFPSDAIRDEPRLHTGRIPDWLVVSPLGAVFAIEVENTADDVIGGVGQARLYASHSPRYVPVVIFPTMSAEAREEIRLLRQHMVVIELDPETLAAEYAE